MIEFRIGVDVGGTFTDIVAVDQSGAVHYVKVPSTPSDPSIGVVEGLRRMLQQLQAQADAVGGFVHGTTVATNALLERNGANVGLLTTKGFRDILAIGRQARPKLYELSVQLPPMLVPRDRRLEVDERTLADATVARTPRREQIQQQLHLLLDAGVESLAICFLHAYANDENERMTVEAVREAAPSLFVSASSQIASEFREFERFSTTVLNAYVQPPVARYVRQLADRLVTAGVKAPLFVMRSSGGVATAEQVSERPVETLLSGPAGGVLGAVALSRVIGLGNLITADVGGTSFDVSVVAQGRPAYRNEGVIEGYPIRLPHIAIHTIGAGGGSIAWIDRAGGLQVGPQSAGALPGPICYGRGGERPTVTDAHAVLGRVENLIGGEMRADMQSARLGIRDHLATPLRLSEEQAADGVLRVVNAAMVRAIRLVTVEQGIDPRKFVLLAYGGAGPLHAIDLARALGIQEVLVPTAPGNFSAFGLLASPLREDRGRTYLSPAGSVDLGHMEAIFQDLERDSVRNLKGTSHSAQPMYVERSVDLRYKGQSYELTVPLQRDVSDAAWQSVQRAFEELHEKVYGFRHPNDPLELVNLRVSAIVPAERLDWATATPRREGGPAPIAERSVYFDGEWRTCPVFDRQSLMPDDRLSGPCVVQEAGSTTVLGPHEQLRVDEGLNLRISVGRAS